jgi:hypothetical protein
MLEKKSGRYSSEPLDQRSFFILENVVNADSIIEEESWL